MSSQENISPSGGRSGEIIPDGHDIWTTQPQLVIEAGNPSQAAVEASTSNHDGSTSSVRKFLDYFGLDTEHSILIDANLERLREKYFIPENFQLITPNLDFYGLQPTQVTPSVDLPLTSLNWIDIAQASMQDTPTLDNDLLYAMMPQMDLHACRRDFRLDMLLNHGFNSILDFAKDCQKAVENKAAKEAKLTEGLKKQLQEKLVKIKEKNKALLDHQRKANEEEKRLLEL
ncbi:hypothetical protein COCNU_scaffold001984G000020 [Cocos nucifera]|nr:hypothetical protein [Cocos nucifera]